MTEVAPVRFPAVLTAVALVVLGGCTVRPGPTPGAEVLDLKGAEVRVLFLGNSLTAGNDLAGLVQAMAAAGGVRLHAVALTQSGFSIEDHWHSGRSRKVLTESSWDYLAHQQGPSSRKESQVHLRRWAVRWGEEARRRGVKPALYMVWPVQRQKDGFKQVSQSYRAAAKASRALILPAGDAWQEALRDEPALPLYGPDGLHPTPSGTYLAALVIVQGLTGVQPRSVPERLRLPSGEAFELRKEQAVKLRRAAEKVQAEEPAAPTGTGK